MVQMKFLETKKYRNGRSLGHGGDIKGNHFRWHSIHLTEKERGNCSQPSMLHCLILI